MIYALMARAMDRAPIQKCPQLGLFRTTDVHSLVYSLEPGMESSYISLVLGRQDGPSFADRMALFTMDLGLYMEVVLWPLWKSL